MAKSLIIIYIIRLSKASSEKNLAISEVSLRLGKKYFKVVRLTGNLINGILLKYLITLYH